MSNFIERLKPDSKVSFAQGFIPTVLITSTALAKMYNYIQECPDEIGWLGTAFYDEEAHEYTIQDVYLFTQKVHATTTEIKPEGLGEFAEEILQQPDGMEIWNNMRMWGHSHVNMGITPSGQDDTQMREFSQIGADWFIRLIANKKGEMKLDLFHYRMGITILDLPWERLVTEEEVTTEEAVFQQIKVLQEQIKSYEAIINGERNKLALEMKEDIKSEIAQKVSKITYTTTTHRSTGSQYDLVTSHGRYVGIRWTRWEDAPPTAYEMKQHSNVIPKYIQDAFHYNNDVSDLKKNDHGSEDVTDVGDDESFDLLENRQAVYTYLSDADLLDLSYSQTTWQLEQELADSYGYNKLFSPADLRLIWNVAQDVAEAQGLDQWRGMLY